MGKQVLVSAAKVVGALLFVIVAVVVTIWVVEELEAARIRRETDAFLEAAAQARADREAAAPKTMHEVVYSFSTHPSAYAARWYEANGKEVSEHGSTERMRIVTLILAEGETARISVVPESPGPFTTRASCYIYIDGELVASNMVFDFDLPEGAPVLADCQATVAPNLPPIEPTASD